MKKFLFIATVILFLTAPKFILAAVSSAPPTEITQIPLNKELIFPTSIEQATISATKKVSWPFTKTLLSYSVTSSDLISSTSGAKEENDFCLHVPIILYHHIQPLVEANKLGHAQLTVDSGIFKQQMEYLVNSGYTTLSVDDLVYALKNHEQLPEKSILVTIDDGYEDNYTYAFLMAKKYELIINFMIPTGLIEKPGYMTWDHLKEMQENQYARIYNHTDTHAPLGLLSREKIEKELKDSKEAFQSKLGMDINIFTYPYGSYNDLAIEMLKENGFVSALTTKPGRLQCESEIMTLHREHVGNAPLATYSL